MPIFNRTNPDDQAAIAKAQQFTRECLARYQLCKNQLDHHRTPAVRSWLAALPESEREKCRQVLNNIKAASKHYKK
jgi:hypothetical protein